MVMVKVEDANNVRTVCGILISNGELKTARR
jgi:hypothetical protein